MTCMFLFIHNNQLQQLFFNSNSRLETGRGDICEGLSTGWFKSKLGLIVYVITVLIGNQRPLSVNPPSCIAFPSRKHYRTVTVCPKKEKPEKHYNTKNENESVSGSTRVKAQSNTSERAHLHQRSSSQQEQVLSSSVTEELSTESTSQLPIHNSFALLSICCAGQLVQLYSCESKDLDCSLVAYILASLLSL